MSHIRNAIVDDIAALLVASTAGLWSRVFTQRIQTERVLSSYLMVYWVNEPSEKLLIHPVSLYRRTLQVRIDATFRIADYEDLETVIGDIAAEIESLFTNTAMMLKPSWEWAKDVSLDNTAITVEQEQTTFAVMEQTWLVQYIMTEGSPNAS